MQSIKGLYDLALQELGSGLGVASPDEDTRNGRACRKCYDTVRRGELRRPGYWLFAMEQRIMAPDADAPAFDFLYKYTLPASAIKIRRPTDPYLDWQVKGRKIFTNDGPVLNLDYVTDIEDVTMFDPLFYQAVALKMAIAMCEEITQSNSKQQTIYQKWKDVMVDAKASNAFESPPIDGEEGSWLLARY